MKKSLFFLLSILSFLSFGCSRQIGSDVYSAQTVGEAAETFPGIILQARRVTIRDDEQLGENTSGAVGGGLAGAAVGANIGGGSKNIVATAAGSIIGATAGAFSERFLKSQRGIEYIVALENGENITVVQASKPLLEVGQKIWLIKSKVVKGRSRIILRQ